MVCKRFDVIILLLILLTVFVPPAGFGDESIPAKTRPRRLLLLGQKPDSHPQSTHEYMSGVRLIARYLQQRSNLNVIVIQADDPWSDGPEKLDGADGVVLFLSEGARWVSADPARLAAFQRLAERGGGISGLHWGVGTKPSEPVAAFVSLVGGCHGGPDRKYKVDQFRLTPATDGHPVTAGITPFDAHDEVYYDLKFFRDNTNRPSQRSQVIPLLIASGHGVDHPVSWAWERPGGGRSFGFTGLHFHENWNLVQYRRLVVQGILWTLNEPIPPDGLELPIKAADLTIPESSER